MTWGQACTRLLVRGQPSAEESLLGFLIRLTESNNLSSPERLYRLIQGSSPTYPSRHDLLKFAHVSGCSFSDLDIRHYRHTLADNCKGSFNYFGNSLSRECFLTFFYPRICPECLSETEIALAIWDLTLVTTCHHHLIRLADTCGSCGKRLSWKRNRICYCNCGFDLRHSPRSSSSGFPAFFSQHISRKLDLRSPVPRITAPDIYQDFWSLSLNAQFALVWLLGRLAPNHAHLKNGHGRAKLGVGAATSVLEAAASTMARWALPISTNSRSDPSDINGLFKIRRYIQDEFSASDLLALRPQLEREYGQIPLRFTTICDQSKIQLPLDF